MNQHEEELIKQARRVPELEAEIDRLRLLEGDCRDVNAERRRWKTRAEQAEAALAAAHAALHSYRAALNEHWLTGIHCDEATRTDTATCYCAVWRSEPQPNVGAAVNAWIAHVEASAVLKAPEGFAALAAAREENERLLDIIREKEPQS